MSISGHRGTLAGIIVVIVSAGSHALPVRAAQGSPLDAAKSVTCTFPLIATGTWLNGDPRAEVKQLTKPIELQFDMIDVDGGTARAAGALVGSAGAIDITVQRSGRYLHFLQIFRTGPLYTTTIFEQESHAGKRKAVHTRHEYMDISLPGFTSKPEQYYGECALTQ